MKQLAPQCMNCGQYYQYVGIEYPTAGFGKGTTAYIWKHLDCPNPSGDEGYVISPDTNAPNATSPQAR